MLYVIKHQSKYLILVMTVLMIKEFYYWVKISQDLDHNTNEHEF